MPHAVFFGASRGIGYFAALHLLSRHQSWTCSLLLRYPERLENDPLFKDFLAQGRVKLIKGDATKPADVEEALNFPSAKAGTATSGQREKHQTGVQGEIGGGTVTENLVGEHIGVDLVVTTLGGKPRMTLHGAVTDQPSLCTDAALVLLHTLEKLPNQPRVIAVSSMGMGDNHQYMPLTLRIIYPWFLNEPHLDKEGMEYLLLRASTLPTPMKHIPPARILRPEDIPTVREGFLPEVIILRPALLTGGDAPPKGAEKTRAGETIKTWQIRRSEVARFLVDECLPGKNEWVNRLPVLGY